MAKGHPWTWWGQGVRGPAVAIVFLISLLYQPLSLCLPSRLVAGLGTLLYCTVLYSTVGMGRAAGFLDIRSNATVENFPPALGAWSGWPTTYLLHLKYGMLLLMLSC